MIGVAIVDDSGEVRSSLRQLLGREAGFSCVCTCADAETALSLIPAQAPDIVILELRLPGMCGVEFTARLKRLLPSVQVMIYTAGADEDQVFRAFEAGADAYLLKRTSSSALITALRELKAGGAPMSAEIARKLVGKFRKPAGAGGGVTETLTRREISVLELLAEGFSAKEIAGRLSISTETVNVHLKHVYQKLNVRSRVEAVIKFLR